MSQLHLLRVFCAEDGSGGNRLGVFLEGAEVPDDRRQAVAADLGLSETVFVDDAASGAIRIFTPAEELDFAGHPSVGTAWLLGDARSLRPPAGEVPVRRDGEDVYVTARPEWGPPWPLVELGSPERGRGARRPARWVRPGAGVGMDRRGRGHAARPRVRQADRHRRGRGHRVGRDEARRQAGRPVEIRQGRGSRIQARPADDGFVEIGGRSVLDEVRDYTLP